MEPLGVAVVIPVLNEGASIAAVISEIPRDGVREIIVVDGADRGDLIARVVEPIRQDEYECRH
jgi:glycosyltransferase involved in cell wall biosynthesis